MDVFLFFFFFFFFFFFGCCSSSRGVVAPGNVDASNAVVLTHHALHVDVVAL